MKRTACLVFMIFSLVWPAGSLLTEIYGQNTVLTIAQQILNERGEVLFRFARRDLKLEDLSREVSIDKVTADSVWAYANAGEFKRFLSHGISIELIPAPGLSNALRSSEKPFYTKAWDTYPSYEEYITFLQDLSDEYPDLCMLDTIGESTDGRLLLALKISDAVSQKEAEPEFFFTSTIHGDEVVGYMLLLRLADYLLSNYETDPAIRELVDTVEIWINPNANPDGTYNTGNSSVSGATRYNANFIDLNRNFPDPEDGNHPDGNSWQPETEAMMSFMQDHNFVLSANYHGGAEVMNFPWDTWSKSHPDEIWFESISKQYADTVKKYGGSSYFSDVHPDGYINGYDWYTISGGRQDYSTYFAQGREITIEVSSVKMPPGDQLPYFWEYNRVAMLDYIRNCTFGIHGTISDSQTGEPLLARIEIADHDADRSYVYSDSVNGDFHRLIAPGTYTLMISSDGYVSQTIDQIKIEEPVSNHWLNIELVPGRDLNTETTDPFPELSMQYINRNIRLYASGPVEVQLYIYNLQGQLILNRERLFQVGGSYHEALPENIPQGIYFCRALVNKKSEISIRFSVRD